MSSLFLIKIIIKKLEKYLEDSKKWLTLHRFSGENLAKPLVEFSR